MVNATTRYLFTAEQVALIRARCEGSDLITAMDTQDITNTPEHRDTILRLARENYADQSDDDIEIDEDAALSPSDIGWWVMAWVFVYKADVLSEA